MKKHPIATLASAALCLCFASAYEPAAEEPSLVLRKFEFDPNSGFASMTWDSFEGRTYVIEELEDPQLGWRPSAETVQGLPGETVWTFQPQSPQNGGKLFRVRELSALASNDDGSGISDSADVSTPDSFRLENERLPLAKGKPDGQAAKDLKRTSLLPKRGIA